MAVRRCPPAANRSPHRKQRCGFPPFCGDHRPLPEWVRNRPQRTTFVGNCVGNIRAVPPLSCLLPTNGQRREDWRGVERFGGRCDHLRRSVSMRKCACLIPAALRWAALLCPVGAGIAQRSRHRRMHHGGRGRERQSRSAARAGVRGVGERSAASRCPRGPWRDPTQPPESA